MTRVLGDILRVIRLGLRVGLILMRMLKGIHIKALTHMDWIQCGFVVGRLIVGMAESHRTISMFAAMVQIKHAIAIGIMILKKAIQFLQSQALQGNVKLEM